MKDSPAESLARILAVIVFIVLQCGIPSYIVQHKEIPILSQIVPHPSAEFAAVSGLFMFFGFPILSAIVTFSVVQKLIEKLQSTSVKKNANSSPSIFPPSVANSQINTVKKTVTLEKTELEELSKKANTKLDGLRKEIQSLAKQLQITFPIDYLDTEIQKTIDSYGKRLLTNSAPLDKVVANLTQKATEDKTDLEKANNKYRKAIVLYNDVLHKQPQKAEELEYYLGLLNNQQIKLLLPQRKWNDFHDALDLIINELESKKPEVEAYRILGLPLTATDEQIEKRVRSLRKANHPDGKNEEDREFFDDKLKEINVAYDVLKKRKK